MWKFVYKKCKTNVGISILRDKKGKGQRKGLGRNEFFKSVFSKEDLTNLPTIKESEFSGGIKINEAIIQKGKSRKKNWKHYYQVKLKDQTLYYPECERTGRTLNYSA